MLFLFACAEWPRFAHLPEDTGAGREPGSPAATAFDWADAAPHDDDADNAPSTAGSETLARGQGLLARRAFEGTGWATVPPSRDACADGTESRFPVYETGQYAGDVDWWVIDIAEAGVLCSRLETENERVRADVLVYGLGGDCTLPVDGPTVDEDGEVLGYAAESETNQWATDVEVGQIAVVAAAYAPDDTERQPYRWGLALLDPGDAPSPDFCPSLASR